MLWLLLEADGHYGYLSRSEYERLSEEERERVEVLAVCDSEEKARRLCEFLPSRGIAVDAEWLNDIERRLRNRMRFLELWRGLAPRERDVVEARLRQLGAVRLGGGVVNET